MQAADASTDPSVTLRVTAPLTQGSLLVRSTIVRLRILQQALFPAGRLCASRVQDLLSDAPRLLRSMGDRMTPSFWYSSR